MKKHKYDLELVERILMDDDYVLHLFVSHYLKTHDKLYIPKRRKNGDYTMKCVFHKERTPSFRYSPRKGIFKCFGCGNGGNILTLYKKYYDCSFVKAVAWALRYKSTPREKVSESSSNHYTTQMKIVFPPHPNIEDDLPF